MGNRDDAVATVLPGSALDLALRLQEMGERDHDADCREDSNSACYCSRSVWDQAELGEQLMRAVLTEHDR